MTYTIKWIKRNGETIKKNFKVKGHEFIKNSNMMIIVMSNDDRWFISLEQVEVLVDGKSFEKVKEAHARADRAAEKNKAT